MRNLACCLLLASTAAFAQNAPDNAAAEALKRRLEQLNLVNPPNRPKPLELARPLVPKVCAIPLLSVHPPGTRDKMPTVNPPQPGVRQSGDTVKVPAPACDDNLFTNLPQLRIAPVNPVPAPPDAPSQRSPQ